MAQGYILALSKSYLDELDRGRKIVERVKIQYTVRKFASSVLAQL
jgi:hypothetical protein